MANFGKQSKQKVSSKQVPNLGNKKSIFSLRKFPQFTQNATAISAPKSSSEYHQPKPGELIANVTGSSSTSRSSLPPNYIADNHLTAPKRQEREVNSASVNQLKAPPRHSNSSETTREAIQKQDNSIPNQTGLPDNLKAGVESLSGYSLDNVRVHYNSPKPAQLQALAYTQGTDIHVATGQEKHLPHEAWHVVQQMQGRVKPTMQMKGLGVNDDQGLEKEADLMGEKIQTQEHLDSKLTLKATSPVQMTKVLQRVVQSHQIEFDDNAELKIQGKTKPENKAGKLNNMVTEQAITDQDLKENYHNGHMVAAMFGGDNSGDNVRVWSDNYEENTHTDLEKKVRYGDKTNKISAPKVKEKGTVTVTTTDNQNRFDDLASNLYQRVEKELTNASYWANQNIGQQTPKEIMIKGLKGAKINQAVNDIPSSVKFNYKSDDGDQNRNISLTTNAGLGSPKAGNNRQSVLNGLGKIIHILVPDGTALPEPHSLNRLFRN